MVSGGIIWGDVMGRREEGAMGRSVPGGGWNLQCSSPNQHSM